MIYATINSGVVAGLYYADAPKVESDVVADGLVRDGWQYMGGKFYPPLADMKVSKVAELTAACGKFIVSGFASTALGSVYRYDSDIESQLNLVGSVALASPIPYTCTDLTGVKTARNHTTDQMKQVLADGAAVKVQAIAKFRALRDQVLAATSISEIEEIKW